MLLNYYGWHSQPILSEAKDRVPTSASSRVRAASPVRPSSSTSVIYLDQRNLLRTCPPVELLLAFLGRRFAGLRFVVDDSVVVVSSRERVLVLPFDVFS